MPLPMTEDQLLTAVIEAATLYGWRVHHDRRSDKAIQQGDRGFPDLVLARECEVRFLELKSEKGRVTQEQDWWISDLGDLARVIRPSDLDAVLEWLKP